MGNGTAQPGSGDRSDVVRADRGDPVRTDRPDAGGGGRSRSGERSRPTLLVNPPTDMRLRAVLDEAMDERSPATPAALEALVRPLYPRLVVRARSLAHESVVVWYVYREGYWVPSATDETAAG